MGYTHYFPQKRDFTFAEFQQLYKDTCRIAEMIESMGISLDLRFGQNEGERLDSISINGRGDGAHETFLITQTVKARFNFCKTLRKQYDLAVCLVLLRINAIAPRALKISSDGDWDVDWIAARHTHELLFGQEASCPWEKQECEQRAEA